MGLDMYLQGDNYRGMYQKSAGGMNEKKRGSVKSEKIHLGYWRKHPNLHGYIVENFADGVDECQNIDLSRKDVQQIIGAIEKDSLPHTIGFFFGSSEHHANEESRKYTLDCLKYALKWVDEPKEEEWRSIEYRASW